MKYLFLMRGLPGSGKSTAAVKVKQDNYDKAIIFSTDDFWGPGYKFDVTKLAEAHAWNVARAAKVMADSFPVIIIDNTCVTKAEAEPYLALAKIFDYEVKFVEPSTTWWLALEDAMHRISSLKVGIKKILEDTQEYNTHNVPLFKLIQMAEKWEFFDNDTINID